MNQLSWTTVQKRVQDLIPQEINPRKITDKQMSDLKRSIKKFNLVEIPALDLDGRILAGHQRIKCLQLLGRNEEFIDVRVPNRKLTDEEAKSYLIGSNALGGSWDFDLLKGFDPELLKDVGFDLQDLSKIWETSGVSLDENFDEKKELAKIDEPRVKRGNIIELGKHRVICGDSTDPAVLQRLFDDKRASLIVSDPIYNIDLDYNKGLGGTQHYGGNVIDKRTDEEYIEFLRKSMKAALTVSKEDLHVFYWNTEQHIWIIQTLYRELGIDNKRVCLWIKNGHSPTPGVAFHKTYEPCIYGTRNKPYLCKKESEFTEVLNKDSYNGNAGLDQINIWTAKRISAKDYEHATSKPPELYEKPIRRCSDPGDIILDSFLGSGSTLIAAEQLGRIVYGAELEPVFCELIIRRFEKLTGIKAVIHSV